MENGFHASIRAQRMLIWITMILATIYCIGWMGLMRTFPPPAANLSADEVVRIYADHNVQFRIGVILAMIGAAFQAPLSLAISIQMARLEKGLPVWSLLQGATGVMGVMFVILPVMLWAVAAFTPERDPQLTLIFHEFAWLVYITTLSLFPMQLLAIVVVAFAKEEDDRFSAFPRWLGYLTAWQLVQSFGAPIAVLFKTGIFSWKGLLPFWLPFVLFGVWMGAILLTMLRALAHQERQQNVVGVPA